MAIQPIDLQTLFTQVDKVGKTQAAQSEGLAISQSVHGNQLARKTDEQAHTVNKAQDSGDGVDKIKDQNEQKHGQSSAEKKKQESDEGEAAERKCVVISDPALGNNIDISF